MVTYDQSIEIECTPEEVYDFLMAPSNYVSWQKGLKSVSCTNGFRPGSRLTFTGDWTAPTVVFLAEVVQNDGAGRFELKYTQGPITHRIIYTLRGVQGGCRLEVHHCVSVYTMYRMVESTLLEINTAIYAENLKNLKRVLEKG